MSGAPERPKAFVLMPFDREFTAIYEQLIRPSLDEAGYEPWRADSFLDQQNILRDIVRGIATAKLVIADLTTLNDIVISDLTTLNDNVLYELGLAHGLKVPTVLLTQSIDELPFDLRSYRVVTYSTKFDEVGTLKDALQQIAAKHAAGEVTFGSPIIDFLSIETETARSIATSAPGGSSATTPEEDIAEGEDEPGFLDALVEGDQASAAITGFFESLSSVTSQFTESVEAHTARIQAISQSGDPGAPRKMLGIAHELSTQTTAYGEAVAQLLGPFEQSLDTLIDRFEHVLRALNIESEEDAENVREARETVAELLESTTRNLETVRENRTLMNQFGAGASRELARAGRRVVSVLDRYLAGLERMEAFAVRTLTVYDEHLADWEQRGEDGAA